MKTFFKWSGGKSKELDTIKQFLPKTWETYYEPFLGGGAVWLGLEPKQSVVGDSYEELIVFFETLQKQPEQLISHLNQIAESYNQETKKTSTKEEQKKIGEKYFYSYRRATPKNAFDKAVRFYLMRQLAFSGMLRFNADGEFNVPYGWYKSLKTLKHSPEKVKELLNNSTINFASWEKTVASSKRDDFVFLDPPYTRKFQKYHPDGKFGEKEHTQLAAWFKTKQTQAMIIINKDDFTSKLYNGYIKHEYGKKYSIQYRNRMKNEDSNAVHILATNYPLL